MEDALLYDPKTDRKKIVAFSPADKGNDENFRRLETSLRKFHSEEELPLLRFDNPTKDPQWWYRATPDIAKDLIKEYHTVVKLDADQIITGDISHIWEGDYDVATVLNDPTYPIHLWDVMPYYNLGLVVMKDHKFIEHWQRLCLSEHLNRYQFREQDLFNLLCSDYHNYKVKCLDFDNKIHGEFAKAGWAHATLDGDKIMLSGRQICVIHFGGGGNGADKGNYRIRFKPEVVKKIDELIK